MTSLDQIPTASLTYEKRALMRRLTGGTPVRIAPKPYSQDENHIGVDIRVYPDDDGRWQEGIIITLVTGNTKAELEMSRREVKNLRKVLKIALDDLPEAVAEATAPSPFDP